MSKEVKAQTKVGVGIHILWKALARDLKHVLPRIPNLVRAIDILEGDGGLGTIYLFHFGPDVVSMTQQKEKVADFDESLHRIGLEVVEGGHLDLGFSYYKTTLQLTSTGAEETLVDIRVTYESERDDHTIPSNTTSATVGFIKCLEKYLVNAAA